MRSLPNTYQFKNDWLTEHAAEVKTLVLGNSHAYYGLRTSMLDSAFSLANGSQATECDEFLLRKFAPQCPHLRTVVFVVDNSGLFDIPLEDSDEWFRCTYYRLYMGYTKHSWLSRYNFELAHYASMMEKFRLHLGGGIVDCDSAGWGTRFRLEAKDMKQWSRDTVAATYTVDRHRCRNWLSAVANREVVLRVADYCQQHRLRLVLLKTPVWSTYTSRVSTVQQFFLEDLRKKCRREYGAVLLDYSSDPRFLSDDFFDTDHLSDVGATKFTHILHEEQGI